MSDSKMITREAVETIILVRNGQRIVLNPGQVFDFTKEEHDALVDSNPKCLSKESVVSLDNEDGIDHKKVTTKQKKNQTNAPDTKGGSDKNDEL